MKYSESNTLFWNEHFGNRTCCWFQTLFSLEYIWNICCLSKTRVAFYIRSYDCKQLQADYTEALSQQLTSNAGQFCDKVFGPAVDLRRHMRVHRLMSIPKTVLLLVTYVLGFARVKLVWRVTCISKWMCHDVMIIIIVNGHSDACFNSGWDCLHFT